MKAKSDVNIIFNCNEKLDHHIIFQILEKIKHESVSL